MKVSKTSMELYAVTDRSWLKAGETLAQKVKEAAEGGITFLQLREKELETAALIQEGRTLKAIADFYGIPFVINDSVEAALACGADGVHVGQSDMAVEQARKLLGPEKIIGASVQTVEQALLAQSSGADYLGVGAVFATSTKRDAKALDWNVLREICQAVEIPVVAIGGITASNLLQLQGSGIDGIAVVSAIFAQPSIKEAVQLLREKTRLLLAGERSHG